MEKISAQEILGKKTSRDLEILKKSGALENFYLAGGTGAALILRHRRSYDLDFFSQQPFNEEILIKKLSNLGNFGLEKKTEGTVIGLFNDTRISFFQYPYKLLKKPRQFNKIKIADLLDIACMKIDAIASRGSKKDFIDLYLIIQNGYSLQELLKCFNKKYAGVKYNLIHILKGLMYFGEAEKEKMPIMIATLEWKAVKNFFLNEINNFAKDLIS